MTDLLVAAAGWAIMEPARNRGSPSSRCADTGLGNVGGQGPQEPSQDARPAARPEGREIGRRDRRGQGDRHRRDRAAGGRGLRRSRRRPIRRATPANKIINALKGPQRGDRRAVAEGLDRPARAASSSSTRSSTASAAPRDLVQLLPPPITKEATAELMRQCDLVVATGSQANVRAAYASGTPAFGVGAGNVASIVDETADLEDAAATDRRVSKTFDNATSCSSENSLVLVDAIRDAMLAALAAQRRRAARRGAGARRCRRACGPTASSRRPSSAQRIAPQRSRRRPASTPSARSRARRFLMVDETGFGADHPFSGEKLSPVLARLPRARFRRGGAHRRAHLRLPGRRPFGRPAHARRCDHALELGLTLPVSRVIVNQAHCIATGGSFDNGLPFSLSMGCGTWGRNNFSDNMNYRHYLNITRVSRADPGARARRGRDLRRVFRAHLDAFKESSRRCGRREAARQNDE